MSEIERDELETALDAVEAVHEAEDAIADEADEVEAAADEITIDAGDDVVVDVEDFGVGINRTLFGHSIAADTGIVDKNVDAAKARGGRLHHRFDFCGLTHVSTVVIHFNTKGFDFSHRCVFFSKAVHHDVGTLLCQCFSNTQTNTTG